MGARWMGLSSAAAAAPPWLLLLLLLAPLPLRGEAVRLPDPLSSWLLASTDASSATSSSTLLMVPVEEEMKEKWWTGRSRTVDGEKRIEGQKDKRTTEEDRRTREY